LSNSISTISPAQRTPVLELDRVQARARHQNSIRMNLFSGKVFAGELVQLCIEGGHDSRELASLMLGLSEPDSGTIQFEGQSWLGSEYSRHFRMRSRIGRVFSGTAWVQSLTVDENIRLSPLHHRDDAASLQKRIEDAIELLSGPFTAVVQRALKRRPAFVDPPILQICQFVRAILGSPTLLILERPLQYLPMELHRSLVNVIESLREKGTAVIWFSTYREDASRQFSGAVSVWSISNGELTNGERTH